MIKRNLLDAVTEARQREADLEALCTDELPDPSGRWRAQDHLAHLAWVRERDAKMLDAVRSDGEIPPEFEGDLSAAIYEATRDQAVSTVIANARRSWDLFESAIEACSDEDFERPHPRQQGRKLVDDSPGNHLGAHLMWVLLEKGDEKGAESVQLWARDLSARLFTDARSRGVGSYNLACFYARVGRAADALPLLREGLEDAPDLKEWSLKDPDLDPIRDDPRVRELLA